jgi:MFS family permease
VLRLTAAHPVSRPAWRTRAWGIAGALSITETVSWGVLYYAFAAFLVPMQQDLGYSAAELTGAFSLALAVAAIAGLGVGRWLDHHSPRTLMTAGSIAGTLLVLAWSQIDGLLAFYLLWAAIGLVMAVVLYEPAFTVLAKHFPDPHERRRAMTAMTLVAALASFIFLPLAQALIDAHGWRDALLVLAATLAAVTVPLHALVLRPGPARSPAAPSTPAGHALRSAPFWLLSSAFVLGALTTIAMTVFAIPFLLDRGHSPAFAAFAVGLIGVSQIPGRIVFARLSARPWHVFALMALGVAVVVSFHATAAVVTGLILLGMGNGMATLARATSIADLYGAAAYGTIASVAGAMNTAARAAGPWAPAG